MHDLIWFSEWHIFVPLYSFHGERKRPVSHITNTCWASSDIGICLMLSLSSPFPNLLCSMIIDIRSFWRFEICHPLRKQRRLRGVSLKNDENFVFSSFEQWHCYHHPWQSLLHVWPWACFQLTTLVIGLWPHYSRMDLGAQRRLHAYRDFSEIFSVTTPYLSSQV